LTRWLDEERKPQNVAAIRSALGAVSATNQPAATEVAVRGLDTSASALLLQTNAALHAKSAKERHERLSELALTTRGNATHGREIYLSAEKTGCSKCHRMGDQGGRIGPDLTGVGRRFARIHLIESILAPSRAIAPAFQNMSVRLKDGQELTGVRVADSESALTLGDAQGQLRALKKDQIAEQR